MEEMVRIKYWIGYILLSVVVFLLIAGALFMFAGGDSVYQDKFALEIGLLENSMLTSNGNLVINYFPLEKFGEYDLVLARNCEIRVSVKDKETPYRSFFCLDNKFIEKQEMKENLGNLSFNLQNDRFFMGVI